MIGIIGSMPEEIAIIRNHLGNIECDTFGNVVFYRGVIGKKNVVLVTSGIGRTNASYITTLMIERYNVDWIINTGIAGGLVGPTKQILLASKLMYGDVDCTVFNYKPGQIPRMPEHYCVDLALSSKMKQVLDNKNLDYIEGTILTVDSFVTSKDMLKVSPTDAIGVEMEGAAIAQICYLTHVPFVSIRFVSDIVGVPNQKNDYLEFEKDAALLSSSLCLDILLII